jgi:hypothetical protein
MKEFLGDALLLDRHTRADAPAKVFRALDQKNFDDFEKLWRPMLEARRAEVPSWEAAAEVNAQDSHWEWVEKALEAQRIMGRDTFAVECAGETQGLMLIDVGFARLPLQRGQELTYVELLATAPWNRPKLVSAPRFKGVGRVLLETAVSLSVDLGFRGRIALHSLGQSESWYRAVGGFTDVEFDSDKEMRYFEMTEADAAAFVSTD